MKTVSVSAILIVTLISLFTSAPASSQTQPSAQSPAALESVPDKQNPSLEDQVKQAKKAHKIQPLVDDPGVDCFDYNVNVVTLVDNDHKIYWKQFDCIRVHVRNNPFLFKYDLSFDEQLVPEDDPLGTFGGKFGLNTSGVSTNTTSNHTAKADTSITTADIKKAVDEQFNSVLASASQMMPADEKVQPTVAQVVTEIAAAKSEFDAGQTEAAHAKLGHASTVLGAPNAKPAAASLNSKVKQLNATITSKTAVPTPDQIQKWEDKLGTLTTQSNDIHTSLTDKQAKYKAFSDAMPPQLRTLTDANVDLDKQPDVIRNRAQAIRDAAARSLDELKDHNPNAADFGSQRDEDRMVAFAKMAAPLHSELSAKLPANDKQAEDLLNQLHDLGERVVIDACTYKAIIDNDFSTIQTGIIDPIDAVLNDPLSFGYTVPAKKREGPWADPESVTMKVTRTGVSPFAATSQDGKNPKNTASSFECSSDTTDLFEFGKTYTTFKDFFSDKPVTSKTQTTGTETPATQTLPNIYMRNQNKPQSTDSPKGQSNAQNGGNAPGGSNKPPTASTADNTVLTQSWFFGKARLVVTGGLSIGFLRKQEFQRSNSISGTTSQTVIGLKTDTLFRLTPMLYGHALLYSKRHDPDAWYATFGVTANSDNKGTDPEFLLGFSRSLAQQKFFATAGVYLGERQKLDGGLQIGQVIPSSLTGDLPVTKSYHAGFAIGLSYRFASTKDPKNNTPPQPAQPTKPKTGGQ